MRFSQAFIFLSFLASCSIANASISPRDANEVIALIDRAYQPSARSAGFDLRFQKEFSSPIVNATGIRTSELSGVVTVYGGLLRAPLITKRAFILILCHELGHIFGGEPTWDGTSNSGQPDYYASAVCMKKLNLADLSLPPGRSEDRVQAIDYCSRIDDRPEVPTPCLEVVLASLETTRFISALTSVPEPKIGTPDSTIAQVTQQAHPNIQCRLDTLLRGAACRASPTGNLLIEINSVISACSPESVKRPRCWFAD